MTSINTATARAEGLKLTVKDGLLGQLTKRLVESAPEDELDDHLGYPGHQRGGSADSNARTSKRAKTILTATGEVVRAEAGHQAPTPA